MAKETQSFQSTSILNASYDPDTEDLEITFATGRSYVYPRVPKAEWEGFRNARSAGQYFHQNIKGVYS